MATAKKSSAPAEKIQQFEKLVATMPEVDRKGATVPYTSMNGHMFSYLDASGTMALKLPKGERELFLEKYETKLFEANGIVQKEFAEVPAALLENTDALRPYFQMSYEYVKGLKPKATKKS